MGFYNWIQSRLGQGTNRTTASDASSLSKSQAILDTSQWPTNVPAPNGQLRFWLQKALIRSKTARIPTTTPLRRRHVRGLAFGVSTAKALVSASVVRRDVFFSDPWWSRAEARKTDTLSSASSKPGSKSSGSDAKRPDGSTVVTETSYSVTLLDGRKATHIRRVLTTATGRRFKEFLIQLDDKRFVSIADIAAVLPLFNIEAIDPRNAPEVIVTEGVAAAQALIGMGFAAVGTLTGALHTPSRQALEPLARAETIYLWPDNDSVGVQHMERIAERLKALGASEIKVIRWQGGPRKGDAADFQEGVPGVQAFMKAARSWTPGSSLRNRGQLAINMPRLPVTLGLPRGARSPAQHHEVLRPTIRMRRGAASSEKSSEKSSENSSKTRQTRVPDAD